MVDTFKYKVTTQSSGSGKFVVSSAGFGDGYSQDVPFGLNPERQTWQVTFVGYKAAVAQVLDFIRRNAGQPFYWRAPNTTADGVYKCLEYNETDNGGGFWALTMKFEQGFLP